MVSSSSKETQFTAYFLDSGRAEFEGYAAGLNLKPAQLLQLLLLREIAQERLRADYKKNVLARIPRQARGTAKERPKVTARLLSDATAAYRRYIQSIGLGPTEAASIIALRELEEKSVQTFIRGR